MHHAGRNRNAGARHARRRPPQRVDRIGRLGAGAGLPLQWPPCAPV